MKSDHLIRYAKKSTVEEKEDDKIQRNNEKDTKNFNNEKDSHSIIVNHVLNSLQQIQKGQAEIVAELADIKEDNAVFYAIFLNYMF